MVSLAWINQKRHTGGILGRDEKIYEEKILNNKQGKVQNAFSQTRTEKHSSLGLASRPLDLER